MMIKGFQKLSLIEYPGKIAAIVFVGKCDFGCHFCYNTDLIKNYDKVPDIPEKEITDFLAERKGLLDGISITGGEPTVHKDLPEFAKKIKDMGFLVMIETNGSNPEMIKELIDKKLVDYIAMDIKAPLEKYDEVAGVKVNKKKIQGSVDIIRNSSIDYEFRTTVIPKHFNEKDALAIGKWLKGSKRFFLQQFRPDKTLDESYQKVEQYPPEKLKKFAEIMKPFFESVKTRGI
ncbi:MAG: anaerobic ribonucleoside-triphosphate reductase activating protein [Candidatus Aenigmarchaeota archaeon]|nr:anaerobic ribonucleoside-triphosphate reductase activating protein [Candidatus Aenigmarchaeota archaeon]